MDVGRVLRDLRDEEEHQGRHHHRHARYDAPHPKQNITGRDGPAIKLAGYPSSVKDQIFG